jgi:uncharacterized protein (TIGR02145 family)
MKKLILLVMGFAVTAALLVVGCENSAGSGTDNKREVTVSSISSGAVGSGYYVVGTTVLIIAGTVDGGRFDHWTTKSNGVTFSNPNEATTSFIMPENNVTVTAVFKFPVNVSSDGTGMIGGGDYTPGETVNINAGTIAERPFGKWTTESNGVAFADANNATTSFTMPANSVAVTAVFMYTVKVSAGTGATGGGDYLPEATVTIKAGTNPDGAPFRKWTDSNNRVTFTDKNSATTTFIMPFAAVTVTAVFGFTDSRDGQTYGVAIIDGKAWMAENLNYETDRSWCYDNMESNCIEYGRLYDWAMAKTVCPSGWKLPDTADWNRLVEFAGGQYIAGKKLKAQNDDWYSFSDNVTDDFGFSALPGGYREDSEGIFSFAGSNGYWWTATEGSDGKAYRRGMDYRYDNVDESNFYKTNGYSVRCIKNN